MDGVDDLGAVDSLEVDRGDPEVGVPELTLNHHERYTLIGELDGVGVMQLMRREPATNAGQLGGSAQLLARGG